MSEETKDLAVIGEYAIITSNVDIAKAVKENLDEGERLSFRDLDTAKLPSQRGTKFIVPDDNGEDIDVSELTGIILHIGKQRVYYEKSFEETGGGAPPDCISWDLISGIGTPGGSCEVCEFNQYPESGGGKPCKEKKLIFMLRKNDFMPLFVPIGVGSIEKVQKYKGWLLVKNIPKHTVETTLTLQTQKNAKGIEYPQLNLKRGRRLSPQEIAVVEKYRDGIMPFISADFAHSPEEDYDTMMDPPIETESVEAEVV